MIIFSKSFPGGAYKFDGPDDAVYAKSESGWIDSELFMVWMKENISPVLWLTASSAVIC